MDEGDSFMVGALRGFGNPWWSWGRSGEMFFSVFLGDLNILSNRNQKPRGSFSLNPAEGVGWEGGVKEKWRAEDFSNRKQKQSFARSCTSYISCSFLVLSFGMLRGTSLALWFLRHVLSWSRAWGHIFLRTRLGEMKTFSQKYSLLKCSLLLIPVSAKSVKLFEDKSFVYFLLYLLGFVRWIWDDEVCPHKVDSIRKISVM